MAIQAPGFQSQGPGVAAEVGSQWAVMGPGWKSPPLWGDVEVCPGASAPLEDIPQGSRQCTWYPRPLVWVPGVTTPVDFRALTTQATGRGYWHRQSRVACAEMVRTVSHRVGVHVGERMLVGPPCGARGELGLVQGTHVSPDSVL